MTGLSNDLRFACRMLLARPLHALVIAFTLALAIGANTAIFSVVEAVLLRPLPYPDAERIATVWAMRNDNRRVLADWADVEEWRAHADAFETLGAMRGQSVNLTGTGTPDRLGGQFVSAEVFDVLGAKAALGRLFSAAEATPHGGSDVVVLSDSSWRNRFGANPSIIGSTLTLNARPCVVVGVLAPAFESPFGPTDVWLPISAIPTPQTFQRGNPNVWAVGRLKADRSLQQAQAQLSAISARLAAAYPDTNAGVGVALVSMREQVAGDARPALLTVLAAVIVVLLIACANIANMQLARGAARQREMALRAALGAGRLRLVQQLLLENLLVCLIAGACGVALAYVATGVLATRVRELVPAFGAIGIDGGVIAFALALTTLAALLCGLSPAWFAARAALNNTLGQRGADTSGGNTTRRALAVAELALALALLVGAGLLARSIARLERQDPGFTPANVLTFQFRLPQARYAAPEQKIAFFDQALQQVRGVPGVSAAAFVSATPLSGNWGQSAYQTERRQETPASGAPVAQTNAISDGYFGTMQIALLAGRDFDARDRADAQRVAIVSAELARREWPGASALGRRVRIVGDEHWLSVVGVAGDTKQIALSDAPAAQIYAPIRQQPGLFGNVVARTAGEPLAAAAAVRAAIWSVDAEQPVWSVHSMDELLARSTSQLRLTTLLGSLFAGTGLLLALVGVYGVMSFMVAQRTREVGIRLAIGARRAQVIGMILGDGLRLTLLAVGIGWLVAAAAARLLASQLFGISPIDPLTYLGIAALLGAVALLACLLPAQRAAGVDPVEALRNE